MERLLGRRRGGRASTPGGLASVIKTGRQAPERVVGRCARDLEPRDPVPRASRVRPDDREARSDRDVVQAIGRLRADPGLYAAMVRNRLERAREFEPDQLIARWSEVLWREVPSRAARSSHRFLAKGRRYRAVVRGARRSWRPFRPSS